MANMYMVTFYKNLFILQSNDYAQGGGQLP